MGKHYQQPTAEARAAIMMMKANNCSAPEIAQMPHRAPSTIIRASSSALAPYAAQALSPKGVLRKDRILCLRSAKAMARSRGEDRSGQRLDLLSTYVRPHQANDRVFPGHWEGDLINGAVKRAAVGVLIERSRRLVILTRLADATAASVF